MNALANAQERLDVLLVIPPGEPGTTPNREGAAGLGGVTPGKGGFRYAPQTLATLAQELLDLDLTVASLDAPALGLDLHETVASMRQASPRLVCVQVSWATRKADQHFLGACGDVPTLALGPSTRWMRDDLAEATTVLEGHPLGRAAGVIGRILAGESLPDWIDEPAQGPLPAPVPAWHLWPMDRYTHLSLGSSTGCDADCLWCPYVVAQGERFAPRTPEDVVAELEAIVARYHPRRVVMRDPAFACDPERAKRICRLILASPILAHGKAMSWECESRPEHFDGELVRLLSLAGCMGCKVGLESIDPQLLTSQRRIASLEHASAHLTQVADLAKACRTWGVALRLYTMVGLPGQTVEACKSTALYCQAIRPATLSVKAFERYPGLRGDYASVAGADEIAAQKAPLLAAAQEIDSLPAPRSARGRRALWRLIYRVIDQFSGGL